MVNLFPYNTFRVAAKAERLLVLKKLQELPLEPAFILGEGANILLTKNLNGLVIINQLRGRKTTKDKKSVYIEVASGESWRELVKWTTENGWSGIENMAFIPGTVGAALAGNIAAYGGNFEDIFVQAEGIDLKTGEAKTYYKKTCQFSYRSSAFNHKLKNIFITKVTIKLTKRPRGDTTYYSRYESLKNFLDNYGDMPPYSPKQIARAVTQLRLDKLPDFRKIGTAGSFFKNPLVTWEKYQKLATEIRDLQYYPAEKLLYRAKPSKLVKIPAGRLLDELGWRGKRIGNVGTWPKHALTVVNFGGATGQEILEFTQKMHADILKNFEIVLEPEVKII